MPRSLLPRLLLALLLGLPAIARAAPPQASAIAQASPIPQSTAGQFTPAQRAEIVGIVRQALHDDPSILRDAVTAMQADDTAKQADAARTAIADAGPALTEEPGDPVAGNPHGNVTVVEFYDTRCPYCRRLLPTMAALIKHDPEIRVVYKDMPILGPSSVIEARALLAAERQGGYTRLQDVLMHDTGDATPASMRAAADKVGLDGARLVRDMQDPAIQARLNANLALARKLGVEGTPALVIGDAMIPGAVELSDLQQAVSAARKGG